MKEDFYIGQVFEGPYPPEAAIWCNQNNLLIAEIEPIVIDDETVRRFEIIEKPAPPAPTREEISQLRELAYEQKVDVLHAQKMRHQVIGDWTEENEAQYEANVIRLSQEIAEQYPYPEE